MKMIFFAACIAVMSCQAFAGNPETPSACAADYSEKISILLQGHENFYTDQDISGKVKITFTVNPDNTFRIIDVDSKNIYLENHALQSLSGQKLDGECTEDGKVYSIMVNFIYVI